MLGLTSYLPTASRGRLVMLAILAIAAMIMWLWRRRLLTPADAQTLGRTPPAAAGSKAPTGARQAPPVRRRSLHHGRRHLHRHDDPGRAALSAWKSLTVGGASGKQTLVVGSSCSVNAVLTTTGGDQQRRAGRDHAHQWRRLRRWREADRPDHQRRHAHDRTGTWRCARTAGQPHEHGHALDQRQHPLQRHERGADQQGHAGRR